MPDNKVHDFVLAVAVSVIIVLTLIAIEELTGAKALACFGIGLIVRKSYEWIRTWDHD